MEVIRQGEEDTREVGWQPANADGNHTTTRLIPMPQGEENAPFERLFLVEEPRRHEMVISLEGQLKEFRVRALKSNLKNAAALWGMRPSIFCASLWELLKRWFRTTRLGKLASKMHR